MHAYTLKGLVECNQASLLTNFKTKWHCLLELPVRICLIFESFKNKFSSTTFICSCVLQNILLLKVIVLFRPWRSHIWFYIIHLHSELGLKTWFLWILYLGININSWKGVVWIFKWLHVYHYHIAVSFATKLEYSIMYTIIISVIVGPFCLKLSKWSVIYAWRRVP